MHGSGAFENAHRVILISSALQARCVGASGATGVLDGGVIGGKSKLFVGIAAGEFAGQPAAER